MWKVDNPFKTKLGGAEIFLNFLNLWIDLCVGVCVYIYIIYIYICKIYVCMYSFIHCQSFIAAL